MLFQGFLWACLQELVVNKEKHNYTLYLIYTVMLSVTTLDYLSLSFSAFSLCDRIIQE